MERADVKKASGKNTKKERGFEVFLTNLKRASKSFLTSLPFFLGIIILLGLMKIYVPPEKLFKLFTGKMLIDTGLGALFGSILAGNPINSYIISHVLLNSGISFYAVTSLIVAWVTVGITQLPYEFKTLGKRFAIARNISCFIFSILVSLITVSIVRLLS